MSSGDATGATAAEIAKSIRVNAGDFDSDLCLGELVRRLFGLNVFAYSPPDQVDPVVLLGPLPTWRIFVRRDLDDAELAVAIGDAVASWWYASRDIPASSLMIEELSDALRETEDDMRTHRSGLHERFDVA